MHTNNRNETSNKTFKSTLKTTGDLIKVFKASKKMVDKQEEQRSGYQESDRLVKKDIFELGSVKGKVSDKILEKLEDNFKMSSQYWVEEMEYVELENVKKVDEEGVKATQLIQYKVQSYLFSFNVSIFIKINLCCNRREYKSLSNTNKSNLLLYRYIVNLLGWQERR